MSSQAEPNTVLPLDPCTRTIIYRAIETILRSDDTLGNLVDVWSTWEGNPDDKEQVASANVVVLSLWPSDGGTEWYSPDAMTEHFTLNIAVDVATLCIDDALNAWTAIERAIMPADLAAREVIRLGLVNVGARSGMASFMPPTFVSGQEPGAAGRLAAVGQIKLEINLFFPS